MLGEWHNVVWEPSILSRMGCQGGLGGTVNEEVFQMLRRIAIYVHFTFSPRLFIG